MRIEWNSDAAWHIVQTLGEVEEMLTGCILQAELIRRELDAANPKGSNRRLNALSDRYDENIRRLKRVTDETGELTQGTRRAAKCFEDAESNVCALMDSLETTIAFRKEVSFSLQEYTFQNLNNEFSLDWRQFPRVKLMPEMRLNQTQRPVQDWLQSLLMKME